MAEYDIWNRTFGLELEFGDIDKDRVSMPIGYKFSEEERSIVNSDMTKCSPKGKKGAEINTRPLNFCRKDVRELRSFIKHCFDECGGNIIWNTGFDGHLYIGDLGLEELKKIFILGYYVTANLKKVFHLGKWFDVEILVPSPTFEFYEKVKRAETIEAFKNVFANSSNRGHYRFPINVMPYFKTGTLEFRVFNSTRNFRKTLETIKFMYSFLNFALTKTEEDFKAIKTEEDFIEAFDIHEDFAEPVSPLIFAEDSEVFTSNIAKAFPPSRKILTAIKNISGEEIACVNPFMYSAEIALCDDKKITIINNSEYNDVVYRISQGYVINYSGDFELLNKYKDGSVENELCLFFVFGRLSKYNLTQEYGMREFKAYLSKIEESIEKMRPSCQKIIDMFKKCPYIRGNLSKAFGRFENILYQQEHYGKQNTVIHNLKKNSDYSTDFKYSPMSYLNAIDEGKKSGNFMVVSRNKFLFMNKIAQDLGVVLYSSKEMTTGVRTPEKKSIDFSFLIPDDDYRIEENSKISVFEVNPSQFTVLQKTFVKKVAKTSAPALSYVVCDGDIVLGAFGFNYSKKEDYSLWLLSDFCTNNNIPKLSKLMLMIIKSQEVKEMIERKLARRVKNVYTYVYTTQPCSMKYRGEFQKMKEREINKLGYECDFGSIGKINENITWRRLNE